MSVDGNDALRVPQTYGVRDDGLGFRMQADPNGNGEWMRVRDHALIVQQLHRRIDAALAASDPTPGGREACGHGDAFDADDCVRCNPRAPRAEAVDRAIADALSPTGGTGIVRIDYVDPASMAAPQGARREGALADMRDALRHHAESGDPIKSEDVAEWIATLAHREQDAPAAGVVDSGPWSVYGANGRVCLQSDDFAQDARLYVNGDFEDDEQRIAYAKRIAAQLNATRPSAAREQWVMVPRELTQEMIEAGSLSHDDIEDAWTAMIAAAPSPAEGDAS